MVKQIICGDAFDHLRFDAFPGIVTSPPDAEEIGLALPEWEEWFFKAAVECMFASSGPVVFYVTDRKHKGRTYSKPAILFKAAATTDSVLAWHKVALRRDVGRVDIHRPGFSHLLAFNGKPGTATPDTFMRGNVLYPNGTGVVAARVAVEWALKGASTICDPFCGQGTIPAVVEALGGEAVGIDIDPAQCKKAEALSLKRS